LKKEKIKKNPNLPDAFNPSKNNSKCLKYAYKALLRSLQKHCQMVFSRFVSTTIFIPAENTLHSEKPGQNSEIKCMERRRCPIHGFYAEKCRKWQNQFTEKLF
jgi:hypothetical protein